MLQKLLFKKLKKKNSSESSQDSNFDSLQYEASVLPGD